MVGSGKTMEAKMQNFGRTFGLALTAALGLAGGAWAQDENSGYTAGQPVAAPARPEVYVRDTFDDWEVRCVKAAEGAHERCKIYQIISGPDGSPFAEFTLEALPAGQAVVAGGDLVTPLGTYLPNNVMLTIDDGEPKVYPFLFCVQKGCMARPGFTAPELGALEKGSVAKITVSGFAKPKEQINVELSLKGFSKAYDSLFD